MPRLFFHIRGARHELSRDELGIDFPDMETAYRETLYAAQDIRGVFAACGRHLSDYSIEASNTADELVFTLSFNEAIGQQNPRLAKPLHS